MTLEGTVVNGVIVLEGSPVLQEGQKVFVSLECELDEIDEKSLPFSNDSHEDVLAALRKSFEDVAAGRVRPFRIAMADIRQRTGLPPLPGK